MFKILAIIAASLVCSRASAANGCKFETVNGNQVITCPKAKVSQ